MAALGGPSDAGWRDPVGPSADQSAVRETTMRPFKLHERIIKERERENLTATQPPPTTTESQTTIINQNPTTTKPDDAESSDSSDPEASNEMNEEFKGDEDDEKEDDEDFIASLPSNRYPKKRPRNLPQVGIDGAVPRDATKKSRRKVCEFCGAQDTPMWRRGPQGKGTLCNACGVKWSLKFRKRVPKKSRESNNGLPPVNDRMTPTFTNTGSRIRPSDQGQQSNNTSSADDEDPASDFTKPREDVWKKRYDNGNWKKERNLTEANAENPKTNSEIAPEDSEKNSGDWKDASDEDADVPSASASASASRRIRLEIERNEKYTWEEDVPDKGNVEISTKLEKVRKVKPVVKKEDGSTSSGNPLFSHLLRVVRDRVVEEDELQSLRDEISNFQEQIKQQEIEKRNLVENSRKILETRIRGLWADISGEISGKTASLAIECFKDVKEKLEGAKVTPEKLGGEVEGVIFKLNTFMEQFQQLANMAEQDISQKMTFEDSKIGEEMDGLDSELGSHYKEVNDRLQEVQDALNKD